MTQKSENINEFWKKFHKVVVDSGVEGAMVILFVNWAYWINIE